MSRFRVVNVESCGLEGQQISTGLRELFFMWGALTLDVCAIIGWCSPVWSGVVLSSRRTACRACGSVGFGGGMKFRPDYFPV
jgi:hypothetical protein